MRGRVPVPSKGPPTARMRPIDRIAGLAIGPEPATGLIGPVEIARGLAGRAGAARGRHEPRPNRGAQTREGGYVH